MFHKHRLPSAKQPLYNKEKRHPESADLCQTDTDTEILKVVFHQWRLFNFKISLSALVYKQ